MNQVLEEVLGCATLALDLCSLAQELKPLRTISQVQIHPFAPTHRLPSIGVGRDTLGVVERGGLQLALSLAQDAGLVVQDRKGARPYGLGKPTLCRIALNSLTVTHKLDLLLLLPLLLLKPLIQAFKCIGAKARQLGWEFSQQGRLNFKGSLLGGQA